MDLHSLAIQITKMEGKKEPVSIAQVKEVVRCLGVSLQLMGQEQFTDTLMRLLTLKPIKAAGERRKKKK